MLCCHNGLAIGYSVNDKAHDILMGSGQRVRFWYGADGQRYKREEAGKITYYIGGVEMIVQGGATTFKRYASSVALQVVSSGIVHSTKFLFQDHLGSLVRIANPDGTVAERLDYDAFGGRRNPTNPTGAGAASVHTPRGFTGHEYVDGTGIIHMNGRIYDQELGRFLQADPVIQAPENAQSWNAYTYVFNNPLAYTDPTGMISIGRWFQVGAAIVVSVVTYGAASGWAAGWLAGTALAGNAVAIGAFGGMIFGGIAGHFGGGFSMGNVAASGIAGGIMSNLQGGKFGHGFLSVGVTAAAWPGLNRIGNDAVRATVRAIIGGTVSKLTGGKFANGAATSALQMAVSAVVNRAGTPLSELAEVGEDGVEVTTIEGRGYKTPEAASRVVFRRYQRAYFETGPDQELVGGIMSVGDRYYYTRPVVTVAEHDIRLRIPTAPSGASFAGTYHTHPAVDRGDQLSISFSNRDMDGVNSIGLPNFLRTPAGTFRAPILAVSQLMECLGETCVLVRQIPASLPIRNC